MPLAFDPVALRDGGVIDARPEVVGFVGALPVNLVIALSRRRARYVAA